MPTVPTSVNNKPPDPPGPCRLHGSPRLGDFGKLHSQSSAMFPPPAQITELSQSSTAVSTPTLLSGSCESKGRPSSRHSGKRTLALGNFARLFDQLGATPAFESFKDLNNRPAETPKEQLPTHDDIEPQEDSAQSKRFSFLDIYSSDESAETALASDPEPATTYSTPASSAPSSLGQDPSPLSTFLNSKAVEAHVAQPLAKKRTGKGNGKLARRQTLVLAYQFSSHGLLTPLYDHVQSRNAKHKSLLQKLIDQRVNDKIMALETPSVVPHGIHVFVDMSNIIIGFQKALRAKYSLSDSARFSPLPALNLSFLHELLVRSRAVKVLNVGCSMRPDKPEPQYVEDLRDLGYRVDLRYRRPDKDLQADSGLSDGGRRHGASGASGHMRYVEDMVDETLQIRIGESVMQYFAEPGTLVIATGDARPAKYSDGFFTYADRALKMGWNVEVVSWRSSLSGAWTNRAWADQWANRFRVVELDGYLDEVFACYGP